MNWTKTIWAMSFLAISGCATQEQFIPQNGPEMLDIYREASGETDGTENQTEDDFVDTSGKNSSEDKTVSDESGDAVIVEETVVLEEPMYEGFTRSPSNEVRNLFPRLPNPDIRIYVYPHLSTRSRVPVPGYTTVIPLFERVQYTFPGETLKN